MESNKKCWWGFKEAIRKADMFANTQFLRYRGDSQYSTFTGGCCSVMLLCVCMVLFANVGLQTLQKNIIYSQTTSEFKVTPDMISIQFGRESLFMFGLTVPGLNLNDPNITYFDLQFMEEEKSNIQTLAASRYFPAEPCTAQHWNFEDNFGDIYSQLNMKNWVCPPINHTFEIGGRITGATQKTFHLNIKKCNTSLHSNCASDAQMSTIQTRLGGHFAFIVGIINVKVNPSKKDYVLPYIEERNYFTFTLDQGVKANAYIQQAQISTDNSLGPLPVIEKESYYSFPDYFQTYTNPIQNNTYVDIEFKKSPQVVVHSRSYNKLDAYCAYVGGVFGTAIALMLMFSYFSQKSYGIDIAAELFNDNSGNKISSEEFHCGYAFPVFLQQFLSRLFCNNKCQKTSQFISYIEQMDHQLDVSSLIKRLMFLENVMGLLFEEHQLNTLHLQRRMTIEEAQNHRKKYDLQDQLSRTLQKSNQINWKNSQVESNNSELSFQGSPKSSLTSPQNQVKQSDIKMMSEVMHEPEAGQIQQEKVVKLREDVLKVLSDAEEGGKVSKKIMASISTDLLWKLGIEEHRVRAAKAIKRVHRNSAGLLHKSSKRRGALVDIAAVSAIRNMDIVVEEVETQMQSDD